MCEPDQIDMMSDADIRNALHELVAENSALKRASQWVSVEDRFPENDGSYICCFNDGVIETFDYKEAECEISMWGVESSYVTHWMPLPDKPEGVES